MYLLGSGWTSLIEERDTYTWCLRLYNMGKRLFKLTKTLHSWIRTVNAALKTCVSCLQLALWVFHNICISVLCKGMDTFVRQSDSELLWQSFSAQYACDKIIKALHFLSQKFFCLTERLLCYTKVACKTSPSDHSNWSPVLDPDVKSCFDPFESCHYYFQWWDCLSRGR